MVDQAMKEVVSANSNGIVISGQLPFKLSQAIKLIQNFHCQVNWHLIGIYIYSSN